MAPRYVLLLLNQKEGPARRLPGCPIGSGCGIESESLGSAIGAAVATDTSAARTSALRVHNGDRGTKYCLVVERVVDAESGPPVLPICVDRRIAAAAYRRPTVATGELQRPRRSCSRICECRIQEGEVVEFLVKWGQVVEAKPYIDQPSSSSACSCPPQREQLP